MDESGCEPPNKGEQSPHDGGGEQGTLPCHLPERLRGTEFHPIEPKQAGGPSRTGLGSHYGDRVALQLHLQRKPGHVEGLLRPSPGPLRPPGDGLGRKQPAARSQARQVYDDAVAVGLDVDVFTVKGELEISKNLKGQSH